MSEVDVMMVMDTMSQMLFEPLVARIEAMERELDALRLERVSRPQDNALLSRKELDWLMCEDTSKTGCD